MDIREMYYGTVSYPPNSQACYVRVSISQPSGIPLCIRASFGPLGRHLLKKGVIVSVERTSHVGARRYVVAQVFGDRQKQTDKGDSDMVILPTMRYLRSLGDPRVHPNGFIQLDLDRARRLHVWHPRNPYRQRTYHTVHDHVFGFVSTCFSGRLVNVAYDVAPDPAGTHVLWQAECTDGEESVLRPATGEPVRLRHRYAEVVQPGETYHFPAFEFHEPLFGEPSLTIIRKDGDTIHQGNPRRPRIAVPVGVEPDNDFRRDAVDADVLWGLIEEAYPS